MTRTERVERELTAWFVESDAPRTPDLLDDILTQTAGSTQRPAWSFPGRWIPMQVAMTRGRVPVPGGARYAVVLAILILAVVVAAAIVGSMQRVLPSFGPALNGVFAFTSATGDIVTGDPQTGEIRTIVAGPELDSTPTFSRDGTRIAFIRHIDKQVKVLVVNSTGGSAVELTRSPVPKVERLTWSPDGARVAWLSEGTVWVAQADGSDTHRVDIDMAVRYELAWRPPNGSELLIRGVPTGKAAFGLFLVNADGSDVRPVTPLDGAGWEYVWPTWSPDGKRVAYSDEPADAAHWQVHVLTIDGLRDVVLEPDDGAGLMYPRWSPDGTRLAFNVKGRGIGVAPADDESPHITPTGPTFLNIVDHQWSPDSTMILGVPRGTGEPWLFAPAGGPGRRVDWSTADFPRSRGSWSEWQRLAP